MNNKIRPLFEQVAGPLLPEQLSPVVAAMMTVYQERLRYALDQIKRSNPAMTADVYVNTVDSMVFNALAYADEAVELVGINAGVAASLPLIASWLLSQPDAYPSVGNCAQELKRHDSTELS